MRSISWKLAHRLRSFGRHGAEARARFLNSRDFLLLILVGGELLLVTLFTLAEVISVVARVSDQLLFRNFIAPG